MKTLKILFSFSLLGLLSSCVQMSTPDVRLDIISADVDLSKDVDVTIYLNGTVQPIVRFVSGRFNEKTYQVRPNTTVCVAPQYVGGSMGVAVKGRVEFVGQGLLQAINVYDRTGKLLPNSNFVQPVSSCP